MSKLILSLAASSARLLPLPIKRALYRVRPLARLIRGGLNRAAPAGLEPVQVAAGGLQGLRLVLDLHLEKDYWLGTYETELQATIAELVQPGMVAYDVGANIGYISLLLAGAVGESGRVFAFEALPENLDRLRSNLSLNEIGSRVEVVPGAVVDQARPVRFLIGPSGETGKAEGSAGRQSVQYTGSISVTGITLDDFVYQDGHPAPHVIKMDIEGGEVLALPGMQRLLREARPLILVELHGPQAASVAWTILSSAGYQIHRMTPGYPRVPTLEALDWKAYLVGIPDRELVE